jgi:hypothetical protein
MQKGRGYRAAIPRLNMPDLDWNHRMPRRWLLYGDIDYGILHHHLDGVHSEKNGFDHNPLLWTWEHTIIDGITVFNCVGTLEYTPDDWIFTWAVVAVTPLSVERQYRQWQMGKLGQDTYPTGFVYPHGSPDVLHSDAGFNSNPNLIGRVLTYPDEH